MRLPLRKPRRLSPGDVVAVVSPSWGGPAAFPDTYEAGLRTLDTLGLRVRELRSTRAPHASVAERVADLHAAFADPEVTMILTSIGGDDSVRLLPHLDPAIVSAVPKIVMGYSDTTTLLLYLRTLGHVAFNGPSVMAGLAQASAYPRSFLDGLRALLFEAVPTYEYRTFGAYCDGYESWADPANASRPKPLVTDGGPRFLRGDQAVHGRLLGGCLEVLEMVRGTAWWPAPEAWSSAVLFLEGSEEVPPPYRYRRLLRSWAVAGHLAHASALLVGRARGLDDEKKKELDDEILAAVVEEAGRPDLAVVTNCDFGHTDPQWILPLGCTIEVEPAGRRLRLTEPAVE